jgi:gamma-glutamyl-gamma-aminobutyrate hydrolase PuuD
MKKVYVENRLKDYENMFIEEGFEIASSLFEEGVNLLCLVGGDDVTPAIYREENTTSFCTASLDVQSFGLINIAQSMGMAVVGICRGSQVMCVHNGGKMVQHIEGHCVHRHNLTVDGVDYEVSSSHHQEAVPLQWPNTRVYRADDGTVELVVYEDVKMFGMQAHPEYHPKGDGCRTLFFGLLEEIM